MMKSSDLFHCLSCDRQLSGAEASVLFRTGFYRVSYRLGCCSACEEQAAGGPAAERDAQAPGARDIAHSRFAHYSISA
ncbi:hypothetical protein HGI30_05925 [Paenibacillus albicereus]|uniref:Uncharacterized protein n=1 Tax=Paenibacillus albicereus TaxID=2726185 RepID=A0A6H2GUR5_9BACL|nr:hypothetical protein [Paenibacillus albicereus]QJC51147.1 hypothetical protein HGI30_05925 [Paenibacillus albicereus]